MAFDPAVINRSLSVDELIRRAAYIGDRLYPYTEKLVFSYLELYKKVKKYAGWIRA